MNEYRIIKNPDGMDTLLVRYNQTDDWEKVLDGTLVSLKMERSDFGTVVMVVPEMWKNIS